MPALGIPVIPYWLLYIYIYIYSFFSILDGPWASYERALEGTRNITCKWHLHYYDAVGLAISPPYPALQIAMTRTDQACCAALDRRARRFNCYNIMKYVCVSTTVTWFLTLNINFGFLEKFSSGLHKKSVFLGIAL
jgi:hypothetical protein